MLYWVHRIIQNGNARAVGCDVSGRNEAKKRCFDAGGIATIDRIDLLANAALTRSQ